eukprot:tig00000403_g289.t1
MAGLAFAAPCAVRVHLPSAARSSFHGAHVDTCPARAAVVDGPSTTSASGRRQRSFVAPAAEAEARPAVDGRRRLLASFAAAAASVVLAGSARADDGADPGIGVQPDGTLSGCPGDSNCVSTRSASSNHYSPPWVRPSSHELEFTEPDVASAKAALMKVLAGVKGLQIVKETDDYVYCTVSGGFPPTTDDLEFYFKPGGEKVVVYRAISRTNLPGRGGSNRSRCEGIRQKLGWKSLGYNLYELN